MGFICLFLTIALVFCFFVNFMRFGFDKMGSNYSWSESFWRIQGDILPSLCVILGMMGIITVACGAMILFGCYFTGGR